VSAVFPGVPRRGTAAHRKMVRHTASRCAEQTYNAVAECRGRRVQATAVALRVWRVHPFPSGLRRTLSPAIDPLAVRHRRERSTAR
jgi:hypothetical protein